MQINMKAVLTNGRKPLYIDLNEDEKNEARKKAMQLVNEMEIKEPFNDKDPLANERRQILYFEALKKCVSELRKPLTLGYVIEEALLVPAQNHRESKDRYKLFQQCIAAGDNIWNVLGDHIATIKEAIAQRWVVIDTDEKGNKKSKPLPLIHAQACDLIENGMSQLEKKGDQNSVHAEPTTYCPEVAENVDIPLDEQ